MTEVVEPVDALKEENLNEEPAQEDEKPEASGDGGEEGGDDDYGDEDLETDSPLPTQKLQPKIGESTEEAPKKEEGEKGGDSAPAETEKSDPTKPEASKPKPAPIAKPPPKQKPPAQPPSPVQPPKNGAKGPFTFSSAPNTVTAKPHVRSDFSHTSFDAMKMQQDNQKLCTRLLEISSQKPSTEFFNPLSVGSQADVRKPLPPANIANSSVTRRKKEDDIAKANLALYKRLQAIKPSKELNRQGLSKDFQAAKGYGANARKFRGNALITSPPKPRPVEEEPPPPKPAPKAGPPKAAPKPAPKPASKPASKPVSPELSPPPPAKSPEPMGPVELEPNRELGSQPIVIPEASNPKEDDDHADHAEDETHHEEEDKGGEEETAEEGEGEKKDLDKSYAADDFDDE